MKKITLVLLTVLFTGCNSIKTYESEVFPNGEWKPLNTKYFGKTEAQRILEGELSK